jgi:hypothetical protein
MILTLVRLSDYSSAAYVCHVIDVVAIEGDPNIIYLSNLFNIFFDQMNTKLSEN